MHAGPNQYVDHKNRNRYDNRKSNLRCCTYAENNRNRGLCVTNKSGVIGVHFDKKRNKWAASITLNGKKIFIGRFENKEAVKTREFTAFTKTQDGFVAKIPPCSVVKFVIKK